MNSINDYSPEILPLMPPSIPLFMKVLEELNEEKIIDYIQANGINAASERFYHQGYQLKLIHFAASLGWTKLIQVLIDLGELYNLSAEDQNGFDDGATPFAFAAINGQLDILVLLLQYGADFNQPFPKVNNQELWMSFREYAKGANIEEQENPQLLLGEG